MTSTGEEGAYIGADAVVGESRGASWTRQPEDLLEQVAWFNRLRVVASVAMLLLSPPAGYFGVIDDTAPLLLLALLTLCVNAGYVMWFRRLAAVGSASIRRHIDFQIAIDLTILTAILHFVGGIASPLVLFYLFHTFIAALLLSLRAAALVAVASVGLICGLGYLEAIGALPARSRALSMFDPAAISGAVLTAWGLVLSVTLGMSVYFVGTVSSQLARRERDLFHLERQLARSEKLASVGTLAAGVAHEINNPVGVIRNKVQILRYRLDDGDPVEVLGAELDVIDKHAERIGGITDGLLTFSRKTPFRIERIELNRLLEEAADLARVPFANSGVQLELTPAAGSLTLRGSPNHLLQVVVNLLLNAKDASQRGDVVELAAFATAGEVVVEVRDEGEGIPFESLSKIFDPFFTTKDVGRGTGLGLAVSHGIIDKHAGRIEVDSQLARGSTFRIVLPMSGPDDREGRSTGIS